MTRIIETPSYYSVLTAEVRYDKRLKPNEKILFGEITSLSSVNGFCNAGNAYFSKLYDVENETISRWISKLEQYSYLKRQIIYGENKHIIERRLYINCIEKNIPPIDEIINTPIDKKVITPIDEKVKENNTSVFNNTSTKHICTEFDLIVQDYNSICGSKLPKVTILSEKRIKSINGLQKAIKDIDFKMLFQKTIESKFLTGSSGTWKCNFDWLMNSTNALKVLEGNYTDNFNKAGEKKNAKDVRRDAEGKTASQLAEELIKSHKGPIEDIVTNF